MPLRFFISVLLLGAQAHIFAQAPSGHPGVEFITPAGDPKNSPADSGDGQNEFTYDTATPGVLRLNLKGKDSEMKNSDGSSRYEYKFSFATTISGSSESWESGYENGQARIVGSNEFEAKGKFTTLPTSNNAFGKKTVKISRKKTGESDWNEVASQDFEVFFPKSETNNPGGGRFPDPNWFYYWSQAIKTGHDFRSVFIDSDASIAGHTVYEEFWSYAVHPTPEINIYSNAAESGQQYGVPPTYTGIDLYALTLFHETEHALTYKETDNLISDRRGWSWRTANHNHYGRTPLGEIVRIDALYPDQTDYPDRFGIPSPTLGPTFYECRAMNYAWRKVTENQFAKEDWSNPGKNHLRPDYSD